MGVSTYHCTFAAWRRQGNAVAAGSTSPIAPSSDSTTAVAAPPARGHAEVAATIDSAAAGVIRATTSEPATNARGRTASGPPPKYATTPRWSSVRIVWPTVGTPIVASDAVGQSRSVAGRRRQHHRAASTSGPTVRFTMPHTARSADMSHSCHPTSTRAAASSRKTRVTTSRSVVGNVSKVNDVTMPLSRAAAAQRPEQVGVVASGRR